MSEDRLQEAIRVSGIGIFDHDQINDSIYWSSEQRRIYGLGPDEPVTLAVYFAHLFPGDLESMASAVKRAHDPAGDGRFDVLHRIVRPDGELRWLSTRSQTFFAGEGETRRPVRTVGAVLDITEGKRAEARLADATAQLETAQRLAHLGSWELDLERDAIVCSDEIFRIVEQDRESFTPTYEALLQLIHPDDRELVENVRASLVGGRLHEVDTRLLLPNARVKYVHVRGETEFSESGEPLRAVGSAQDITERVEAEEAVRVATAQLAEARRMEAIGTLASGIAHDFNNILASIIGNTELALHPGSSEAEMREALVTARQAARRGADLVQQILAFSPRTGERPSAIALGPVVQETVMALRSSLPPSIELVLELDAAAPNVVANETQIHRIVANLCTNAFHAIGEDPGRIEVRLAELVLDRHGPGDHAELPPGRYARLSFVDTGRGMEPTIRERIFEPFFTTKDMGRGTGLGLAVVHGIVNSLGGAISVVTEPGVGTTFDLYLPATDAPVAARERESEPQLAGGGGGRILFVDDEPSLASLGQRALERAGFEVSPFTEPEAALQVLRTAAAEFDLVMVDFNMPGMSGIDLARELAAIRPELPVVLMSGYVTDELETQCALLGVSHILHKPTSLADLTQTAAALVPALRQD